MRKTTSLALCSSLLLSSLAPALAADGVVRSEGSALRGLPVVKVETSALPVSWLDRLAALPSVVSTDAQAIDAAALLGPAPTTVVEPVAPSIAVVPGLNAAVEATAEEAVAQSGLSGRAQLDRLEAAALAQDPVAQEKVWSGLRDGVAGVPVMTAGGVSRFAAFRRVGRWTAAAASGVALNSSAALASPGRDHGAAAPAVLPHWLQHIVTQYAPYLSVAAAAGIIYGVNRVVQAVVEKVVRTTGGDENTVKVAKRVAGIATWSFGAIIGLHLGGAPATVIAAVAGLGTTAVTIASKQVLGNALEASKVLLYHSFVVGDRIKIGDDVYKVADLSLRYVTLQNEAYKSSPTNFTYLQLAALPLTILRPYVADRKLRFANPGATFFGNVAGAARKAVTSTTRKTWLWLLGSLAVAVAAPYVAPLIGIASVSVALTYLKAAAIFLTAHKARSILLDFIQTLGEKTGKNPQTILVWKLIAEVASYTLGGSAALRAAGTTWTMLVGGSAASGLAFTLVTQDILSNLVTAGWLMSDRNKQKSIKIGEYYVIGKTLGKVVDMNMQYVVLEHDDKTHTLVSYAYIKESQYTWVSPDDLPEIKKKFLPPAAPTVPFKIGDSVSVGGWTGKVVELEGQRFTLQLPDGSRTSLPVSVLKDLPVAILSSSAPPETK